MDLKALTKQIDAIGAEKRRLIAAREAAINRRAELEKLALPLEEEIERVCGAINAHSSEYANHVKQIFASLVKNPLQSIGVRIPNPFCIYSNRHYNVTTVNPAALLAIFADEVKTYLATQIATWDRGEVGPHLIEREAEMARLDEEIIGLEKELQDLRSLAERAGVRLN